MTHMDDFLYRHVGTNPSEMKEMVKIIGVDSLETLLYETIPENIKLQDSLHLPEPSSEYEYLDHIRELAAKNNIAKSFIGLGYYDCITPSIIQRNVFENPGWYTQYTPYQAEISQGRLEALLNFQTMVSDLTGMEVANASLLDEATAAAEAMTLFYRVENKLIQKGAKKFFVSDTVFPQTKDVLKTRAEPLGIVLEFGDFREKNLDGFFGAIVQYPAENGRVYDYSGFIKQAQNQGIRIAVAADLLSLLLLTPPGELGADVVVGSTQRFGVPLGYGGPHAAYFATREKFKRQVPGRIVGVSYDKHGKSAYRMALQTREQHIRREKATSNICTSQVLLAIMAGMYAVYHGPKRLKTIAERVHKLTRILDKEVTKLGFRQTNDVYFDTLNIELTFGQAVTQKKVRQLAEEKNINFRYLKDGTIGISFDETTQPKDVQDIVNVFSQAVGASEKSNVVVVDIESVKIGIPDHLSRKSDYLTHPVFNTYHTETKMMRYVKSLENKDLSLTRSMIPLGSCTMKLNAATEMLPVSWPHFAKLHPFVPVEQAKGYTIIFKELENYICEMTGFVAASLQPNSGAQGEYTSLMVIRAYHRECGQDQRNVMLIPSSAHGTNPASAIMAGMDVIIVACDENGNIDIQDLEDKVHAHKDNLAGIMITYPSTHGVFEKHITDVCALVHENGGQVFMDGANMNAQVGLTNPAKIGADVCHLNLHKTFSIPHGGGGPGMGPICVAAHLADFLPRHVFSNVGGKKGIPAVSASAWGSPSILLISYAYIRLLGYRGVTEATKQAILNANYIKARLEKYYPVLYVGENGRVAHELIFDLRSFKSLNIEAEDIAKRLMDYGFHAPTMSWPVIGTMMVEPTESESRDELDRFCDAMIEIRKEIDEIKNGDADPGDNVLKNAPHTADEAASDQWEHKYDRKKAVFPFALCKGK